MVNQTRLAVEQFGRAVDGSAESRTDRLVSEADAEQRGLGVGADLHQIHRRSRALRSSGARAQENAVELRYCTLEVCRQLWIVVAPDHGFGSELAEVLHQVEHKAVVVVDDENPHESRVNARAIRRYRRGP